MDAGEREGTLGGGQGPRRSALLDGAAPVVVEDVRLGEAAPLDVSAPRGWLSTSKCSGKETPGRKGTPGIGEPMVWRLKRFLS